MHAHIDNRSYFAARINNALVSNYDGQSLPKVLESFDRVLPYCQKESVKTNKEDKSSECPL